MNPNKISRKTPPPVAVVALKIITPKRSAFRSMPAIAPEAAKAATPIKDKMFEKMRVYKTSPPIPTQVYFKMV